jgi:hypothetical protein
MTLSITVKEQRSAQMTLRIMTISILCRNAESRVVIVMLSVVLLNVVMQSVVASIVGAEAQIEQKIF